MMVSVAPSPVFSRCGRAWWAAFTVETMSMSIALRQPASLSSVPSALTLATKWSMPPLPAKSSIHFFSAVLSVTSSARAFDAMLLGSPVRLALLHELGVARAEADDRAFGHESIDDGAADALGAAGDQHALALETEIHNSPETDARL